MPDCKANGLQLPVSVCFCAMTVSFVVYFSRRSTLVERSGVRWEGQDV